MMLLDENKLISRLFPECISIDLGNKSIRRPSSSSFSQSIITRHLVISVLQAFDMFRCQYARQDVAELGLEILGPYPRLSINPSVSSSIPLCHFVCLPSTHPPTYPSIICPFIHLLIQRFIHFSYDRNSNIYDCNFHTSRFTTILLLPVPLNIIFAASSTSAIVV